MVRRPPLRSGNDLRGSDRARQDATRTIVQETHHVLRESREFKQCVLVSHSRDSQQRHCALRTRCIRQLELRRSWQPRRNFLFNLRPSRRDEGHVLSKYSGRPNRSFWTHVLIRLDSRVGTGPTRHTSGTNSKSTTLPLPGPRPLLRRAEAPEGRGGGLQRRRRESRPRDEGLLRPPRPLVDGEKVDR